MEVHCLGITKNTYALFVGKSRSYLLLLLLLLLLLSYVVNIAAKAKEISRAMLS
jgi:hypothetical protein